MPHRDHLDEGTIHAWLDGALSADEARAVEEHVADCASCAAAVAEARGLIAASSRILAKLDAIPGGVVPRPAAVPPVAGGGDVEPNVVRIGEARSAAARPRRWWRSPSLRAAAAVLFVATGALVVVREQDGTRKAAEDTAGFTVRRSDGEASSAGASVTSNQQLRLPPAATPAPTAPVAPPAQAEASAPATRDGADAGAVAPRDASPRANVTVIGATSGSAAGRVGNATAAAPPPAPPVAARMPEVRVEGQVPVVTRATVGSAIASVREERDAAASDSAAARLERSRFADQSAAPAEAQRRSAKAAGSVLAGAAAPAQAAAAADPAPSRPMQQAPETSVSSAPVGRADVAPGRAAVAGVVRNAQSGSPLVGTSVRIRGANRGAMTDNTGGFVITDVPPGPQVVEARMIGYASAAAEVVVSRDSVVRTDLAMTQTSLRLSEVVVGKAPAAARQRTVRSLVDRVAGCYGLKFGTWSPALAAPALPGRIGLDAARAGSAPVAPGDSAFLVRDAGGWRHGYWTPLAGDSVRIVLSDGSAGAEVRAHLDGETLRGVAATFSDDDRRPAQRAAVTMRRERCGAR